MSMILLLDNEPFRMGRIVHFIDGLGKQHPMLLTSVHKSGTDGKHHASGVVFDYRDEPCVLQVNVPYDSSKKPMTWHWPTKFYARDKKKSPEPGKPLLDLKTLKKVAMK
jgi:hypothetical protein